MTVLNPTLFIMQENRKGSEYMLMDEVWKDVVVDKEERNKYKGIYQVSNYGRVKRIYKNNKEKIINHWVNNDGYSLIKLCKDKKQKHYLVSRLVAIAFIPNPDKLPEVNHKNENPANNYVDNLEWCNRKYNMNYGTRVERTTKKISKQVFQYDKNFNLIHIWKSTNECGRNGYDQAGVGCCCRKERKTHKGYIWSYESLKQAVM